MKLFRAISMALLLVAFAASAALAQNIQVVNGTNFEIHQLGLIDSNASGDAQDLLGDQIMGPNQGLTISISGGSKGWELIAVDGSGGQVNWQNLDLTGVSQIILRADGTAEMK